MNKSQMTKAAKAIGVSISEFEKGYEYHLMAKGASALFVADDCPIELRKAFIYCKVAFTGKKNANLAVASANAFNESCHGELVRTSKNSATNESTVLAICVCCPDCGQQSELTHLAEIAKGRPTSFGCGCKTIFRLDTTGKNQKKKFENIEAAFAIQNIDASGLKTLISERVSKTGYIIKDKTYAGLTCKCCQMMLANIQHGALLTGAKPQHIRHDGIKSPNCPFDQKHKIAFEKAQAEHDLKILTSVADFAVATSMEKLPIQHNKCGCKNEILKQSLTTPASAQSNGCATHSLKKGVSQDKLFRIILKKIHQKKKLTPKEIDWMNTTSSVNVMTVNATNKNTGQEELIVKCGVATGGHRYKNVDAVHFSVDMPRLFVYYLEQSVFAAHTELFGYCVNSHEIDAFKGGKTETAHIKHLPKILKTIRSLHRKVKSIENVAELDIPADTHQQRSLGVT